MNDQELIALLSDRPVGVLTRRKGGQLGFAYFDEWRDLPLAFPLSLSLPLSKRSHAHEPVDAFLWGLLPDNERVLERWGRTFHVSARNVFALLQHVGEDCAGAVQFVDSERVETIRSETPEIRWLDEADVAERLRVLRGDQAAWRLAEDAGYFSLAGAQPKTALLYQDGRWGVPAGRAPTTHILKPPVRELEGHVENEHFCLLLARALGLPTAASEVQTFGAEIAIVIERYDRARTAELAAQAAAEAAAVAAPSPAAAARTAGAAARAAALAELAERQPILRLHQEDLCQALGLGPHAKYQSEGGPSPKDIAALLRTHSSRATADVQNFADALIFNWLIGGTDGHAKNYSLLHGGGGRVRLAPFYDIASALPYPELNTRRMKLAMKLGGKYRLHEIGARELRKLAGELRLEPDVLQERALSFATQLPDQAEAIAERCGRDGLRHPILRRLPEIVIARARSCAAALS